MGSRSAWEPRWKYQAGRQTLCVNAAAEAALEGEWFDTPQPVPPERVKRKYTKRAHPLRSHALQETWKCADITGDAGR